MTEITIFNAGIENFHFDLLEYSCLADYVKKCSDWDIRPEFFKDISDLY